MHSVIRYCVYFRQSSQSFSSFLFDPTMTARRLTDKQKNLIRQTWREVTSECKLLPGVKIFQNIFRRCPDLKKLFKLEHINDVEDLPNEDGFIRHARVFSNMIDLSVRNVDELDIHIAPALITFGRRHFYKHQIGFRPEYMSVFALAMMDFVIAHLPGSEDDEEVIQSWLAMSTYLVAKLKQGYELESLHKGSKQRLQWPPIKEKFSNFTPQR